MSNLKKSATSVVMITIFTLASKFLGFFREALIASNYGSSAGTDTYFIAMTAVTLFSTIIYQTINTTMIPVLSDVEAKEGKKGKVFHLNNFLNITLVASLILIVIAYFTTPLLMEFLGKGFEGEQFEQAISIARIGLPFIFFSSLVGVFRGYLQSEERFNETALGGFPTNIVFIVFLLFFSQHFSIKALMVTAVIAEAAQLIVQVPALKQIGYRYKMVFDLKDKYIQQVATLIPPVLIGVAVGDFNSMIDQSMASSLPDGSVSALNYGNALNNIVLSVFITSIITVVFPMLSKEANKDNTIGLKKLLQTSLNFVLLITIPASVGIAVLANPIVKLAYQRGEFGELATTMTSGALTFYALGLTAYGVNTLLTRVFYSLKDTKSPMINGVYGLSLNIVFNLILVRFMAHNGLAFASTISATLSVLILLFHLRKKIGHIGLRKMGRSAIKILVSALIMGIGTYLTYHSLVNTMNPSRIIELMIIGLAIIVSIIIYLISLYLFKVEELLFGIDYVKKIIEKRKNK